MSCAPRGQPAPAQPRVRPSATRVLVPLAVMACGLLACDGTQGVTLAELPAQLAALECAVRPQCTGRPLDVPSETCASQTTSRLASTLVGELADAVARGTAVYDARAAKTCLAALEAEGCARFQTALPEACLEAAGGLGTTDTPCVSDFDCRADHSCRVGAECPGACRPRGVAGEDCDVDRDCAPGLRCPDIGGRCAVPIPAEGVCDVFGPPCAFGTTCFSPTILDPGQCLPVLTTWSAPVGATCAILASYFCGPGLSCPILSERAGELPACRAGAGLGQTCVIGIPDPCPPQAYCEGSVVDGTGTCTVRVPRGQACAFSRQCAEGDVCDGGVCVPRQGLGGPCASEAGCWSRSCAEGVCVSPNLCR
ncbi:MAG: hypothetical protein KA712_11715 [Myxococcales bacterium]|nr:hypothetical protein [Myxococcales bacterium]